MCSMSERPQNYFADSILKGGLQSTSTAVGDTIAENTDLRSSNTKKMDEASTSLGEFGKSRIALRLNFRVRLNTDDNQVPLDQQQMRLLEQISRSKTRRAVQPTIWSLECGSKDERT